MIKHQLLLIILTACSAVSFSQEDNWDVYMAQYEKGAGSTLVNLTLKENAPIKQFPFLLQVGVELIACTKEGLPSKEEFDLLYEVSDRMKAITDSLSANKAAGTFSYQCKRTDYFYIADTANLRKVMEAAFKSKFPDYVYFIKIQPDPKWEAYLDFLYPNDETYEYMLNEKVILGLQKAGDGLSKPRQVDHWLYFKTDADREKFIQFAAKENYKIEKKDFIKDSKLQYQLQISRTDPVDVYSISKITIGLRKKAKEMNGDYDGWETFVVK